MKRSPRAILTIGVFLSVAAGCSDPTQPGAQALPANTAPTAYAGADVLVPLPAISAVLNGSATDAESNIEGYAWKKIYGPDSYSIESPASLRTNVTNLEEGWYEFELTVTDAGGLTGKDTVGIWVYDPRMEGENAVVITDLRWSCPMGCSLSIKDFRYYAGSSTAIRVFLKEEGVPHWIEAASASEWAPESLYSWEISDRDILIYVTWPINESGAVDVMINF
jgi:hypothetical protein